MSYTNFLNITNDSTNKLVDQKEKISPYLSNQNYDKNLFDNKSEFGFTTSASNTKSLNRSVSLLPSKPTVQETTNVNGFLLKQFQTEHADMKIEITQLKIHNDIVTTQCNELKRQ